MDQPTLPRSFARVLAWASILILLCGCAATYARFHLNEQVAKQFQHYEMIPGYHYYYSGRENKPSAIIGINPAFTFSSKLWTAIDPSQFETTVNRMFAPQAGPIYGADILAPDGRKAGVWYSWVLIYGARFKGNRIFVHSPEEFAEPNGTGGGIDMD